MNWIVITAIIIIAIFLVIIKLSPNNKDKKTGFQYQKRDALFSPAERSFFGVLNQAVGNHAQIFAKVRVADVITPKKGMTPSDWQKAFNKISSKHFDYLLCNKDNLSVLCAIELNDKSHNSKKRKDRDLFLELACQSANLPLIQVPAKAAYSINEIQNFMAPYLSDIEPA